MPNKEYWMKMGRSGVLYHRVMAPNQDAALTKFVKGSTVPKSRVIIRKNRPPVRKGAWSWNPKRKK
jgi:hypothetical protein